jgi:hypothetical protein
MDSRSAREPKPAASADPADDAVLGGIGDLYVPCRGAYLSFTFPIAISLKPNVPLTYQVRAYSQVPSCHYNLAITVEQLM